MKSLTKLHYLFLAAALAVGFACCDSDDDGPAEPEPVGPVYNESDVEVVRAAFKSLITNGCYGIWPEDSMEKILEDPGRWNNVYALWRLDEATNEHRIVELHLYGDGRAGLIANVPSSLGKLDKLKCLKVWGNAFYGEFPEEVCGLKNLTGIMIRGTNLFSIPEDLFNENMDYVWVTFNRSVTKLPGSVVKLRGPNFIYKLSERKYFNFNDNSFEGRSHISQTQRFIFSLTTSQVSTGTWQAERSIRGRRVRMDLRKEPSRFVGGTAVLKVEWSLKSILRGCCLTLCH